MRQPEVFMQMAEALAQRTTCPKLAVGCVLLDANNRVIGTGFNGVPRGVPHCYDTAGGNNPCPGSDYPAGSNMQLCHAVHAEQNALLFCTDIMKVKTCFVTEFPCLECMKMLMQSSCIDLYITEPKLETEAYRLWIGSGRYILTC